LKKLLVFALTCILVLSFAVSANAATAYVDLLTFGDMERTNSGTYNGDGDLTGRVFGFNHYTEKAKFAVEYLDGAWDYKAYEYDISSLDLKGGYEVFENGYLTIGTLFGDIEDYSYDAILVGLDASFNLSEDLVLEGSAAFSFSGEYDYPNGYTYDANVTSIKARLIYIFEENIAASFGYRLNVLALDNSTSTEYSYSSLTGGISYRF